MTVKLLVLPLAQLLVLCTRLWVTTTSQLDDARRLIDTASEEGDESSEIRASKALLVLDALLFHDVKGTESCSRRQLISDRIRQAEDGMWAVLWATLECSPPVRGTDLPEGQQRAGRVDKLLSAGRNPQGCRRSLGQW